MKNHELLNLIGEANGDYVLETGDAAARPWFRWQCLAACAACAAMALGVYRTASPTPEQNAVVMLHAYTVVEERAQTALEYATFQAMGADETVPGVTYVGGDHVGPDGDYYGPDVPVQPAAEWYDALLHTYRLEENPEWYGGAWLAEDEVLAVAIADGFHTPELEAELKEVAGAGAVLRFSTAKYSMEFLYGLMDPVSQALKDTGLRCGVGVDVTANCLGVDVYSDGAEIPDSVLAELAQLDPTGDAVRVRVFTQAMSPLTNEIKKDLAPDVISTPAPGGAREFPEEEVPAYTENCQPAQYDILPRGINDLPQAK